MNATSTPDLGSATSRAFSTAPPVAPTPAQAGGKPSVTGEEDWPKTREEYEKKYDSEGDNWPRSREEYIDRFGRPPRKKDGDPGFRIATDK